MLAQALEKAAVGPRGGALESILPSELRMEWGEYATYQLLLGSQ